MTGKTGSRVRTKTGAATHAAKSVSARMSAKSAAMRSEAAAVSSTAMAAAALRPGIAHCQK
jgi:hypothetical protein